AGLMKNSQDTEKVDKQSIIPNHFKKAQKNLSDILNVKVEIKTAANGKKGKIVLDFKNEEELESILAHIR
ncbi:MAG: chromosome partitioning protein ParB, partial [Chryseobacterium sp.]